MSGCVSCWNNISNWPAARWLTCMQTAESYLLFTSELPYLSLLSCCWPNKTHLIRLYKERGGKRPESVQLSRLRTQQRALKVMNIKQADPEVLRNSGRRRRAYKVWLDLYTNGQPVLSRAEATALISRQSPVYSRFIYNFPSAIPAAILDFMFCLCTFFLFCPQSF